MRGLWPREHGAYAQLGIPVVAALGLAAPTPASLLLALAAVFAFLANEPLVVLLGHRGARRQVTLHGPAVRRLALTAAAAALTGGAGLLLASSTVRAVAGLVAVPAALLCWLSWRRSAHTLLGELVAAVVLPGASAPVAVAAGMPWPVALQLWVAWSIGYAASVVAVHRVLAKRRGVPVALVMLALAAIALAFTSIGFAIAIPLTLVSLGIALRAPSPRRLRAIGVALVVTSTMSASLLVVAIRARTAEDTSGRADPAADLREIARFAWRDS